MKRQTSKRVNLARETLHSLDKPLGDVAGAAKPICSVNRICLPFVSHQPCSAGCTANCSNSCV